MHDLRRLFPEVPPEAWKEAPGDEPYVYRGVSGEVRPAARSIVAHATARCPSDCSGFVDTRGVPAPSWEAADRVLWTGVPCSTCDRTWTVEVERQPDVAPDAGPREGWSVHARRD